MRRYEGSRKDRAEDKRGAKQLGVSLKAYERTPRDKREDKAGEALLKPRANKRPGTRS